MPIHQPLEAPAVSLGDETQQIVVTGRIPLGTRPPALIQTTSTTTVIARLNGTKKAIHAENHAPTRQNLPPDPASPAG
ncbi:hypothetical protein [Magnetospirillum sp. XM-1]|uniref:hypothetical protein n=1 Tax=Magnetospirillum sp. XM-1 TaxID=1663591 RepID=UPI001E2C92E9|nr:hypothetical protein [Magnetospirillum sp. XM-1]